jgi:predicted nuclease of predicted toxin-antitoxin system
LRAIVDNQLPVALARWLSACGHDVIHVLDLGLERASDIEIWNQAARDDRIVVSKDEDFFHLANRPGDTGRLLWVRVGNCRREALVDLFARHLGAIAAAFDAGQRILELR